MWRCLRVTLALSSGKGKVKLSPVFGKRHHTHARDERKKVRGGTQVRKVERKENRDIGRKNVFDGRLLDRKKGTGLLDFLDG